MGAPLIDQVRKLDAGIANAYQKVDAKNTNSVDAIFMEANDGDAVTPDEAEALALILDKGTLTKPQKDRLIGLLVANIDSLFKGAPKQLKGDKELKEIYDVLSDGIVDHMWFDSDGTWIGYNPNLYRVIKKLIQTGEIEVHALQDRGLSKFLSVGGVYRFHENQLMLTQALTGIARPSSIIHELTHAIQDWRNNRSQGKYLEADAYIAEATALKLRYPDLQINSPILAVAYDKAAQFVLDREAVTGNKSWQAAYKAVVKAVEANPVYAQLVNDKTSQDLEQKEAVRFFSLWNSLGGINSK